MVGLFRSAYGLVAQEGWGMVGLFRGAYGLIAQ